MEKEKKSQEQIDKEFEELREFLPHPLMRDEGRFPKEHLIEIGKRRKAHLEKTKPEREARAKKIKEEKEGKK